MTLTPLQEDIVNAKICPYCYAGTKIITETEVYGKIYRGRKIIACNNFPVCDSYVGTHDDETPLGRLADKPLRALKGTAHHYFDKIWKEQYVERTELYEELSEHLDIPGQYTHIGMFSEKTCIKVTEWAKAYYIKLKHNGKR